MATELTSICIYTCVHTHTHTHTASMDESVPSHEGGSKTATDGKLSVKILDTMLTHAQLVTQRQRETVFL